MRCRNFRAFGLAVESDFALPGIPATRSAGPGPCVTIHLATAQELRETWSGSAAPPDWETVLGDGVPLKHEVGVAGDHRFSYGSDIFHVSSDAGTVLCAVEDPDAASWQRQLLDTILFSVSFASGYELLHASAVEVSDGIIAIVAPSGGGKSSLATEFGRRGHRFFCDDVLAIGQADGELVCYPAPAVMSVPSAAVLPASLRASVIARFPDEDELWVALDDAASAPRVLRAVYRLERFAERCSLEQIAAPTILDLLPHAISLPHGPERARRRFELFSALAGQIAMFQLNADPSAPMGTLADLVEPSLGAACAGLRVG